jgi:cellulose synthase/poly-beta-1,6-N-acetylglucosamine synthase-like glycosyltransferase
MIALAFWLALAVIAYTYVGYPLLVLARARFRPRPIQVAAGATDQPSVTVVLAAHNEAAMIAARLDNLLALDYPVGRIDTIVASDGSTDETVEIARGYADRGVRILDLGRVGKADALNTAVGAAGGEIVVFTDANTMFEPGAVRALVRPFADPDVGGAAGDQRYLPPSRTADSGAGERSYWDFERRVKHAESLAGSTIAATGAIYAIRRELFQPVITGVTDDFITSTAVVAQGRRLVFAPDAVAWEPVAASNTTEYGRKVRIMTRGLRGVAARRALLDPRRTGFYAVQLASHKILRRLMAVPLLVVAVTSILLAGSSPFYLLLAVGGVALTALGAIGLAAPGTRLGRTRVVALPAFFLLVNIASLNALWNLISGRRIERWEPRRADTSEAPLPTDTSGPGGIEPGR